MKRVHSLNYLKFELGFIEEDEDTGQREVFLSPWFKDALEKELGGVVQDLVNDRIDELRKELNGRVGEKMA